jgi:3-deoxy-7-phosphoheptulonate synthase
LEYGKSVTDACIDLGTTEALLEELADAARRRSALG